MRYMSFRRDEKPGPDSGLARHLPIRVGIMRLPRGYITGLWVRIWRTTYVWQDDYPSNAAADPWPPVRQRKAG